MQMLTKRCETLSHAAEVESKKTKRELAALEKEVAALKVDISSKEKEAKVRTPPGFDWLKSVLIHLFSCVRFCVNSVQGTARLSRQHVP